MFSIFSLSDFFNNYKSNVVIIPCLNLALYQHKISSPDSPDGKSPSFGIDAWVAWNRVASETFH